MRFGTATTVLVSSEIQSKAHCCLLDATGTTREKKEQIFTLTEDPWCQNGEQNVGGGPLTFGAAIKTVIFLFFIFFS